MKKIINLSLIMLLCFVVVTGCGKKKENNDTIKDNQDTNVKDNVTEDGTLKEDKNENDGVIKEQVVEGITLKNIELKYSAYSSTITINAINNTNEDITFEYFEIYFKDKDGNNLLGEGSFAVAPVFGTIESKNSKLLSVNVDRDLSMVYSIDYKMVK